ncbi:MAG: hypothetical protein E7322_09835 [Clostridiales bacterium]|nr:hypothetical protein [Clostridiales bacterium]
MKKIVALLLALLFVLASVPVYAKTDFDSYTTEELISLRVSINVELLLRGAEKDFVVPIGVYTVGEDIPAGSYTVRAVTYGYITLYEDADSFYSFSEGINNADGEYIGKLTLEKGNIVKVLSGRLLFSPYQGLGFSFE